MPLDAGMKNQLILLLAVALLLLCPSLNAWNGSEGDSPAVHMLDSQKDAKILDGGKLKIARPFLKRTPMGVIIDEIEMMIICPLDSDAGSDTALKQKAQEVLKRYNLVREIDDERSKMDIYIDTPQNDRFSEIILYHTRPEPSIMLFVGNFTVESLVKVGEVSEQQRKHLKKNK